MKRSIAQKALALVLSAMLLLAPLSGCQGRDDPSEPSSSSQSSSEEPSSSSEELAESSSQEESSSSLRAEPSSVPPVTSSSSSSPASSSTPAPAASTAKPFAIPAGSVTKVVVSNGGHETYDDVITVTGQEDITALVQLFNGFADSVQKERINPPTGGLISKVDFYYSDGSVASYGYHCSPAQSSFYFSTGGQSSQYTTNSPAGMLVNEIPEKMLKKYPTNSSYFNYNGPAKGWILDNQNMLYFPLTQGETSQILAAMRNFGTVKVSEVDPGPEGWSSTIRIARQNATEDVYDYECHSTGIAVDGGKFFLVDTGRLNALYSLRDSMTNRTTGIPQWLVVMNASRATNMQITAGGKVYSTDSRDIIADVAALLKQLSCHTGTLKNPSDGDFSGISAELRRIDLDFDTGTRYTITFHENGELVIAATGMDFMCVYQAVSGQSLSALQSRVDALAAQGTAAA